MRGRVDGARRGKRRVIDRREKEGREGKWIKVKGRDI